MQNGEKIIMVRGDTFVFTPDRYLGSIAGYTNVWFSVKADHSDLDTKAQIQIDETTGLLYIAGEVAATPANGNITVSSAPFGIIVVTLNADETIKLTSSSGKWFYDIQYRDATNRIFTLYRGEFICSPDVTRTI